VVGVEGPVGVEGLVGVEGPELQLMAGPITSVDKANIAANTAAPTSGARQLRNRRYKRHNRGIAATAPSRANNAVPPDPATRAVPAKAPRDAEHVVPALQPWQ
jgi:hypothetical protein